MFKMGMFLYVKEVSQVVVLSGLMALMISRTKRPCTEFVLVVS